MRQYLVDTHLAWLERFEVDAIRMDTVKHVEPEYFAEWTSAMRDLRPGMYMVGELLDENSLDPFGPYLDAGFDGLFNFPLRRALVESFAQGQSADIKFLEAAGRVDPLITDTGRDAVVISETIVLDPPREGGTVRGT